MSRNAEKNAPPLSHRRFATTRWSLVIAAGRGTDTQAGQALEKLCRTYWYPIYAYIRRRGYPAEDAEDLTQEFFTRILDKDYLARADCQKGKFRSFLLAGVNYLLCDEYDKARRLKRGEGQKLISIDQGEAERRYGLEPADTLTPESAFELSWVTTLLTQAAHRLREEYAAAGKAEWFEQLNGFRLDAEEPRAYAEVALRLRMSESAVKSAIRRLRIRQV